ncbi:hypothetical protein TSUD_86380 [Trifolium subterraneum]|uniref:Ubiquitin-conjugating enzyme E2 24 n=1 Tax=Trifolium subterraneum TaxID=3900 RepID=A0A2Z6NT80_TRISU|nr:hypothetical protein TSUD_86380 [Trifolium subterraneum]
MDATISDSEWETSSSSDSSSSEDQEEIDFQYGGQAQSILSSLEESIGKIDDFLSFERTFVNGDVVCSLSDPSGQMGRVTSCDLFVDLENVKGKILKNINSKELSKIRSISEGDHVIKGPWLGHVQRVVDKVTVLFDDGAKSDIIASEREKVLPLTRKFPEDSQCPYYPGQRVKVKSSETSKSAAWLCGTWRDKQDEGTICAVDAGLVYVNWITSVLVDSNLNVNAPPCWQDSKNLTVLSSFSSHANWQLGDWCMLSVADKAEPITMEHSMTRGCKSEGRNLTIGELFIIGKIKAKVDILWQNGEHTLGLDPENLLPVNVINTHEFWPHQFVLEKGASYDPSSQRWGVVQCVDAKEHTVKVQWKTVSVSKPNNLDGDRMEETVSAYELVEHPDYSCFYGDIMFKAAQNQFGYQADEEKEKPVSDSNAEAALKNGNQMSYHDDFPDDYYLSCVGTVMGFKDGDVEVKLATGFTTKVAPYEIFRIDKHEDSTVTPAPQEMIECGSLPSDKKERESTNGDGRKENCENNLECSSFFLPRAAFELFSSIKSSIFQTLGGNSISGAFSSVPTFEKDNESDFLDKKDVETCNLCIEPHPTTEFHSTDNRTSYPEVNSIHEKNDFPFSLDSNSSNWFKQFDVIESCCDHHFFDEAKGLSTSQVKRGWVKKVQQEWSILEKSLPEFVKHFEALVEEHFKKRSKHILFACKEYLEGASIGCGKTEHENQRGTSAGFKIMLAKLFPKLVDAFSDKGIDSSQFVELQE